jgi:hypothetical protein
MSRPVQSLVNLNEDFVEVGDAVGTGGDAVGTGGDAVGTGGDAVGTVELVVMQLELVVMQLELYYHQFLDAIHTKQVYFYLLFHMLTTLLKHQEPL